MAGRMSRAMAHLPHGFAQGDGVAVLQPPIGGEGTRVGQAVHPTRLDDAVDPELIGGLGADDLGPGLLLHLRGAPGVVQVRMGDPDLVQGQPPPRDFAQHRIDRPAGIDHGGLVGGGAPHGRAVLLERRDGRDEDADGRGLAHGLFNRDARAKKEGGPKAAFRRYRRSSSEPGAGAPGIGGTGPGGASGDSSGTSTMPRPTWLLRKP